MIYECVGEWFAFVAKALGELGDARAVRSLIKALGDCDSGVRRAAAEALSLLGQPQWKDWIKGDGDDLYRLGRFGQTRAVEPLIQAFRESEYKRELQSRHKAAGQALMTLKSRYPSIEIPHCD